MPHYKVRYAVGEKGEHTYPESVAGIVWKNVVYHGSDAVLLGETDDAVAADERQVIAVQADRLAKVLKEFEGSHRAPAQSPEESAPTPREPRGPKPRAAKRVAGRGARRRRAKSPRA